MELAQRECGRLCQARDLIMKARASIDRRANTELAAIHAKRSAHLEDPARKEQLALLPAKHAAILRTSNKAKRASSAPATPAVEKSVTAPPAAPRAVVAAAATASAVVHKMAEDGQRLTKKDLDAFVKETVDNEEQMLGGKKKKVRQQMGNYADYWDRDGRYSHNWWCWDNPNWRGPFGDPCVEYAVGGDRNFWCDWDGAQAMNACPRSCGTCSYAGLRAEDRVRLRDEHMMKQHFAPHTVVEKHPSPLGAAPRPEGPTEPTAVVRRRSMSGAVLREVEALKDKLREVLRVTRGVAHDQHAMRKHNKQMSSQEAANDLTYYFDKQAAAPRPRAAKDTQKLKSRTSAWGIQDLMSWFDGSSASAKPSPSVQKASLAAKATRGERSMSATRAKQDLEGYWVRQSAKPTHLAVKSGRARKFTAAEAHDDIRGYWDEQTARGGASPSEHKHSAPRSGLVRYSSTDARKDLAGYLKEQVVAARKDDRKTLALAAAARRMKRDAPEAVASQKMTSKEAAEDIKSFWDHHPAEAVHVSAAAVKGLRPRKAAEELRKQAEAARRGAAKKELAVNEAAAQGGGTGTAPAGGEVASGAKGPSAPKGAAVHAAADAASDAERRESDFGLPSGRREAVATDGTATGKEPHTARDLGLPTGPSAAVSTPRGMSASTAHSSIDSYFSALVKRSQAADTFDIKTRAMLKARALKRAQAKAAQERAEEEQRAATPEPGVRAPGPAFSAAEQHAEWERLQHNPAEMRATPGRQQQLYLQAAAPPPPPPPPPPPVDPQVVAAEGSFLAGVDRQVPPLPQPQPQQVVEPQGAVGAWGDQGWQPPQPQQAAGYAGPYGFVGTAGYPVPLGPGPFIQGQAGLGGAGPMQAPPATAAAGGWDGPAR
jgi:hypothetical protein